MRTGLLALLAPVVLATGCMYQARVNQQLLQRELRLEEDCIYRLKWQLEDTQRELETARAQAESLQKQSDVLRERGSSGGAADVGAPSLPRIELPGAGRGGAAPPRLPPAPRLPAVEPGIEAPSSSNDDGGEFKGLAAIKKFIDPAVQAAGYTTVDKSTLRAMEQMNPNAQVERILINPGLSGGLTSDGQMGGSEMLGVAIEQRDPHDARISAPGDVSIVVVDPALKGPEARIGKWSFDADEVAKHVRRNHDGASLQFELPWTTPPQHTDLRLFVRFVTYDGRRLEANMPIEVQLGGDGPGKWRKSKAPLAEQSDQGGDDGPIAIVPANKRQSVYDTGGDKVSNDKASSDDRTPRTASRKAGWSPYR